MNSLQTYFEKMNNDYIVSVDRYYNGYLCEYSKLICAVYDIETMDPIDEKEIDLTVENAFHVFSEMCKKYGV